MHLLFLALRCLLSGFLVAWAFQIFHVLSEDTYHKYATQLQIMEIVLLAIALFVVVV